MSTKPSCIPSYKLYYRPRLDSTWYTILDHGINRSYCYYISITLYPWEMMQYYKSFCFAYSLTLLVVLPTLCRVLVNSWISFGHRHKLFSLWHYLTITMTTTTTKTSIAIATITTAIRTHHRTHHQQQQQQHQQQAIPVKSIMKR